MLANTNILVTPLDFGNFFDNILNSFSIVLLEFSGTNCLTLILTES